jgi:hypothetical protein
MPHIASRPVSLRLSGHALALVSDRERPFVARSSCVRVAVMRSDSQWSRSSRAKSGRIRASVAPRHWTAACLALACCLTPLSFPITPRGSDRGRLHLHRACPRCDDPDRRAAGRVRQPHRGEHGLTSEVANSIARLRDTGPSNAVARDGGLAAAAGAGPGWRQQQGRCVSVTQLVCRGPRRARLPEL